MKKICIFLLLFVSIVGCSSKNIEPINYIKIDSMKIDMSSYKNMKSLDHHFEQITPKEFLKVYEEKGSGAFYIGSSSCPVCQEMVQYIEKSVDNNEITIYYIDAYNKQFPLKDYYDEFFEILYPILEERDGEKTILMPHLFIMINGEFKTSNVGGFDGDSDYIVSEFKRIINPLIIQ